ncbi:hypothetical protein PF002_g16662 [Phytophthora fragariae]|uniref:Protein kinase domain-containing protein n=1 Tax=Phytophthora fragariae TaxID=53985 RepID=A0A6A3YFD0_9STRA|nr:hypothetical protein PF002_g16662 [Phytophthora fragariae]
MPHRRGVTASVPRTLLFHVASLTFACVLSVFFLVTGSALLLVVGCLLVGSSQFARKLTRILWRSEMAINALVAEEGELAVRRRPGTVLGEVTLPVMLLSMLYFLVFKWVLNVVFSVVPLVTWAVSVAQVLPEDAGLADLSLVVTGTTAAQALTAVAFAFLAHQIGVTSARVQGDATRALERRKIEDDYGTMRVKQHKPSAEVVTWNLNREPRTVRIRQKHAEWKQRRYERKARKYELKLRAARDKIDGRRGDTTDLLERYIGAKERDRYAREIEQVAVEAFHVPETKQDAVRRRLHSSDDAKARASRHATVATAPPVASPVLPLLVTPVPIAEAAAAQARARLVPRAQPSGDPRKRALSSRARGRPSFAWEGEISNVDYDVVCTEGAAFGRVLFKARITVGSSVAVLNSFVLVGSRTMDPSELEADVLEGWMDVMEQTYREIPFRSLEMKELVGQGYFGDAYRATLDGQDVVVKTIRASEFGETTSQIVREFQHEAAMLNMFGHHPCIVPFVGASTDTKFPLALVTQYLPYGSLEDNLRVPNSSTLTLDERTGMLKDAAAGLLNIHEGGFIHRDLAARNCLVDQGNHVRICDFGLCRRVKSETARMLMKDAVGPVKYMAPESLQPPHAFSYDSDVYMFGVLMWETYTNSSPFASLTSVEAMMHVLRGERLPVPRELPASLQRLMQNCFHDSPAERPSMQEVLMALDDSLISSQRASVAIAATTAVATATAAAATSTAMAKSVTSRTNLRKEQDRSIWV